MWMVCTGSCKWITQCIAFYILPSCRFLYVVCACVLQTIVFANITSLTEATQQELEKVISALSDLCDEWRFLTICSVFATTSNSFRVVVDVNSFVRHLSPADIKVWTARWRSNSESVSPTARATREDLDAIEKDEPGSLVLEDWSEY